MHELEFLSTFYCLLNFSNLDDDLDMISLLQFLEWVDELLRIFAYYLSLGFCASAYVIIIISSLGCVDLTVLFHLPSSFYVLLWPPNSRCLTACLPRRSLSTTFCLFLFLSAISTLSLQILYHFYFHFRCLAFVCKTKRREGRGEMQRCLSSLLFPFHSKRSPFLLFPIRQSQSPSPSSRIDWFRLHLLSLLLWSIDSVTQSIQHSAIQWLCCPPSSIQFSISFAWFAVASLVHSSGDFLFLRTRMHICHCQIIKSISLHLTVIVIPALNLDCYHWFPHCPPPPFFFPFLPLPVTIHLPLSLSWTNTLTDIQKCRNVGIIAVYLGSETEECSYSCKQYAFWQRCDLWYPFDLCK